MCDATFRATMVTRAAALAFCGLLAACGGGGGGGSDGAPSGNESACLSAACGGGGGGSDGGGGGTISPATATVPVGGQIPFTLSSSASTTWSVDGQVGGNGTIGTISSVGLYAAPLMLPSLSTAVPPSPLSVTVSASAASNTASVTVVSRFVGDGTVSLGSCATPCAPNAVIAPDLNDDGFSDLVTANAANGTISVVMRESASAFLAPVPYNVGISSTAEPQALVAGDFNGDSLLRDVAIADADSAAPAVWVRSWRDDGTFPTVSSVGLAGSNPLSIASGRFDLDIYSDVVVANFLTSTLSILRGNGVGVFQLVTTISSGIDSPLGIVVADFNQDTFDDIAVANTGGNNPAGNTVVVFLSARDGTFGTGQSYAVPGGPSAVAAVDLNTDGCPDLAVTAAIDSTVTVLLNQKVFGVCQSTFSMPAPPSPTGPRPIALASGDWNKDGLADLVVANHDGKTITIFLGNGNGTLVNSETYPVGNAPQAVAVGDFNGDSWPDLAVANSGDDTVSILRNRGQ